MVVSGVRARAESAGMITTRSLRRLGLAAGTLLALAAPSAASASATVEADRVMEGDRGQTQLPATVTVTCDNKPEPRVDLSAYPDNYCLFYVFYDAAASTAKPNDDVVIARPREEFTLKVGESRVVPMSVAINGDKYPELDEKLAITVREQGFAWFAGCVYDPDCPGRISQVFDVSKTYEAGTLINDDGPRPRDNITKKIGKAKAPVNAPESQVERYDWNDGTSVGANCVTQDAAGWKGAFGVWGYYIPGCVVKVPCPAGRECVAHASSTIRATGYELTNVNQRLTAHVGNVTPPWKHDTGCEGATECTATDDSIRIRGGGSAELQCSGVHAANTLKAGLTCRVDLEFVE
jgi:hypothetical protein